MVNSDSPTAGPLRALRVVSVMSAVSPLCLQEPTSSVRTATSEKCLYCCKNPKMPCGQFPANRLNEPKSQSDIASRPLPKSPVSSSQYDVVPQMIIRSPSVRPGEFASVMQKDFCNSI